MHPSANSLQGGEVGRKGKGWSSIPDVQTHTQVAFPFGKIDGSNSLAHSGAHSWHIRAHSGTFGAHSMFSQPCLHAAVCENTQFSTVAAHTGSTFNATDLSFYKIKMVQRWGSTVRSTHFFIDLYLAVAVMPFQKFNGQLLLYCTYS